ncbi:MAG: hypothetical protein DI598_20925 [Pseudopedobacter saltans]|uniref:Secretion system C-terminal sorting domain-containing protein n=1 Tax=Pseudopedobacter saltans TaxID=151895 RepID=A0A2W5E8E6_9SPHI|nr:MAG: hypothetical protein DI598_20925 [Pseudopedobacter saltans]
MKKIYLLASIMVMAAANAQVSIDDNFESYTAGSYFGGHWSNWSGATGGENLVVTTTQAASGTKSGTISVDGQDVILKIPTVYTGVHTYQWKMLVPANKSAWMAFMEDTSTPSAYGDDSMPFKLNFNTNTFIGDDNYDNKMYLSLYASDTSVSLTPPIDYPIGQWATYKVVFDLDSAIVSFYINGTKIIETDYTAPGLSVGGADLWKFDTGNIFITGSTSTNDPCEWYIDDFVYGEGDLATTEVTANSFSVYPTLVSNQVFNVSGKSKISSVEVYNIAGQQVLKLAPNATSVEVNTSKLVPGTYIVNVTGEQTKLSKKIIVK